MSPAATAESHVASYQIQVDGTDVKPEIADTIGEIKIVDSLMLPDSCDLTMFINSYDPEQAVMAVDEQPFEIGKELLIKVGAIDDQEPQAVLFRGDIVAVDVDFGAGGIAVGVRAYDGAHKLHRSRNIRVFQNQTSTDAVKKVLSEAGFSIDKTHPSGPPHEWLQQDNETDWEFIWRLARRIDFWLLVEGEKASFVRAGTSGETVALEYPLTLHAFHPRVTAVQQVAEVTARANDPKSKSTFEATAATPEQNASVGLERETVSNALEGGAIHISGESILEQDEIVKLAQATLDRIANAYIEADGHVQGNPKIKAGAKLQITGLGQKLSGTYLVGTATHTVSGGGGFETHFSTATATPTTLAALAGGSNGRTQFGDRLVIGIVSNNNDPDNLGRVKVKFPALSDADESGWMRIATPSAGAARGLLMLPQPDEEVLVGFENGDTRRGYVLGSLFNGKDKPGDDLIQQKDGTFALLSDKRIVAQSKEEMQLKSTKKMTVLVEDEQEITVKKDRTENISGAKTEAIGGNYKNEAKGTGTLKATGSYTIESTASVTIKAPSITVEGTASLTLKAPSVTIQGSASVNISGALINLG